MERQCQEVIAYLLCFDYSKEHIKVIHINCRVSFALMTPMNFSCAFHSGYIYKCMCIYAYNFCMEGTWEHVSVHWQQSKCQLWAHWFMCWYVVSKHEPLGFRGTIWPPTAMVNMLTTWLWPSVINGLPPAIQNNTQPSNASQLGLPFLPLGCLYLALTYRYTFLYGWEMKTRLHALATGWIFHIYVSIYNL